MKKKIITFFLATIILTVLLLSGCGKKETVEVTEESISENSAEKPKQKYFYEGDTISVQITDIDKNGQIVNLVSQVNWPLEEIDITAMEKYITECFIQRVFDGDIHSKDCSEFKVHDIFPIGTIWQKWGMPGSNEYYNKLTVLIGEKREKQGIKEGEKIYEIRVYGTYATDITMNRDGTYNIYFGNSESMAYDVGFDEIPYDEKTATVSFEEWGIEDIMENATGTEAERGMAILKSVEYSIVAPIFASYDESSAFINPSLEDRVQALINGDFINECAASGPYAEEFEAAMELIYEDEARAVISRYNEKINKAVEEAEEEYGETNDKIINTNDLLMELYNTTYSEKEAFPYFVNLDNDSELEMIVACLEYVPGEDYTKTILDDNSITVFDVKNNQAEEIYSAELDNKFSIIFGKDGVASLLHTLKVEHEIRYYMVSFEDGKSNISLLTEGAGDESFIGSVIVYDPAKPFRGSHLTKKIISDIRMYDYSTNDLTQLILYATEEGKKINDAQYVESNGEVSLYATLENAIGDVERQRYDNTVTLKSSYVEVVNIDSDSNVNSLGRIELINPEDQYGDSDLEVYGYGTFDFGDIKHYYVNIVGIGYGVQYKYGDVNGKKQLIDSDMEFIQTDDEVYCVTYRDWGEWNSSTEYVEVEFEDNQYKQYYAEDIDLEVAEKMLTNCNDIILTCTEELYGVDAIQLNEYEATSVKVERVEFSNIKKGSNEKYYITFSIMASDLYMDDCRYDLFAYYTCNVEDDKLIKEERVNYTSKLNVSMLNLPVIK